jgi:dTDP-4-dehydrorhamnose 3,5-epimerase
VIFTPAAIPGIVVIEPEPHSDERGFFARTWCQREFAEHELPCDWVQSNVSFNTRRGTLRGLHYQAPPWEEAKLVRCTMGAIYDVAVDVRPESPCFGKWCGYELTAENRRMLYIAPGFAHGFQTLMDRTEVLYQMSAPYHPEATRGFRWNDSAFSIRWPEPPSCMSPRDEQLPPFRKCA